jgi:sugar/nucleoside kinase (ribokinase family)
MYLLLIGHFVLDTINFKGNKFVKPGGIYYSTFGLNLISNNNDSIKLLTQIDKLSRSYFSDFSSRIDTSHVSTVERIPNVHLTIFENEEREEKYLNFTNKLDVELLLNEENFDGILLNMITGIDISMNDLKHLRKKYKCPIYIDLHSLAKKLDAAGIMKFMQIKDIEVWLSNVDIVQANENELRSVKNINNELQIAEYILSFGPRLLIVTKGENGSIVYYKGGKEINTIYAEALQGETKNKVGCGDIFGAVFFYTYLKTNSAKAALQLANLIAGLSTKTATLNELIKKLAQEKILND